MNVGHPSNMSRLIALYEGVMDEKGNISKMPDLELMKNEIFAVSINDQRTKENIKETWDNYKVMLEPHGSVGWAGLLEYLKVNNEASDQLCISLETAHPAKFPEEIIKILNIDPELPPSLESLEEKTESLNELENNYKAFKDYLQNNY
jgi:threonine synthase